VDDDAVLRALADAPRRHLLEINPVPINEIAERWISKFERSRLSAPSGLKNTLEGENHD
jgi:hypothetical protein